jgi:hypothetical protein
LLPDKKNENLATFEISPVKNALCSSLRESFSTCFLIQHLGTASSFIWLKQNFSIFFRSRVMAVTDGRTDGRTDEEVKHNSGFFSKTL